MREVPISSSGLVALVDDEDFDRVMEAGPWHPHRNHHNIYAQRRIHRPDGRRTTEQMHRFLTDGASEVDHRNGNGLDNRRSNLRPATHSQNLANSRLRSDNTSGYKGVTFSKAKGTYIAQIRVQGKRSYIGSFPTAEAAAWAYDTAAALAFGQFARLNFPQENAA